MGERERISEIGRREQKTDRREGTEGRRDTKK